MQCYTCGSEIKAGQKVCSSCGQASSKLIYVHFCAVVAGIVGSLIGYTLYDMTGAFLAGLFGIVAAEVSARLVLRPRRNGHLPPSNVPKK